jgi:spore coat protein W
MTMDNLKKVIDSTLRVHPKGSMADMLLSEVLRRHGVSESELKGLSSGQKKQITQVVANIQSELGKILD